MGDEIQNGTPAPRSTPTRPARTAKGSQASIRPWATFETGEALADELASWDRALYHTAAAIELSLVVRTKQTRLTLGLYAGALAVLAPATGAAYSLFVGFR